MFEPVLEHHRHAYARYERQKRLTFVIGLLVLLLIGVLIVLVGAGDWVVWAMSLWFASLFVGIGWFEVRKTVVFRRDLHERQRN
jgi:uncharacterized membrane protein